MSLLENSTFGPTEATGQPSSALRLLSLHAYRIHDVINVVALCDATRIKKVQLGYSGPTIFQEKALRQPAMETPQTLALASERNFIVRRAGLSLVEQRPQREDLPHPANGLS